MHRNSSFIYAGILLTLCLASFSLRGQQSFAEPLDDYNAAYLPEKVFVHTDKDIYAGGETVYAAVYLVNGISNQPASLSKTIYLELVAPADTVMIRLRLFAADGHTSASMLLPADIEPGDYQIAAYTNYQRNSYNGALFRKAIRIVGGLKESGGKGNDNLQEAVASPDALTGEVPDIALRFFPESGDCLVGQPCRVAFTCATADGRPATFTGKLLTADGSVLQAVSTNERGIGSFTFQPDRGKVLVADEATGREFALPPAVEAGAHIRVDVSPDTVDITMFTNDAVNGLLGHTFVLQLRGAGLLEQPFTTARPLFKMRLPVTLLPAGVIIATLLDDLGNPVAERLFFVPPRQTDVQVSLNQPEYDLRSTADLTLKVPQAALADSLNAARLSVSVLPVAAAGKNPGDDIRTWLLLNSDVDHPVQQAPDLIFGAGSAEEKGRRVDDFLLTRAWRRFRWEALPDLPNFQPEYLLERGLFIRGQMTKFDAPETPRPGKVFLTRMENAFSDETLTDMEGYFTLGPYMTTDTFPVLLQGRFKPGRKNRLNPAITLEDNQATSLKITPYTGVDWSAIPSARERYPSQQNPVDYAEVSRKMLTVARNFDSLIIDLQTIDVSAQRINKVEAAREDRTRNLYSAPTRRIVVADDAFAQTTPFLLDVMSKLNGVRRFTNPEGEVFFNIRNAESISGGPIPAAIYLDGLLTRVGRLAAVQMRQVEFIDVLTPQRAVRLGPDAEGGAIMIFRYTDGRGRGKEPGLLESTLEGYHTVREFATFDPTLPDNQNRPDLRTTLHWEPLLRSGADGTSQTSFTTSDQTGTFYIFIQGLRNDGTPLYGEGSFVVRGMR